VTVIVSVSDAKASKDPGSVIATFSLGSCIAVSVYDPAAAVGGMLHFQLPDSTIDAKRAKERPLMFADTGRQCLLREMESLGAQKRRLKIKLAGGAQMLDDHHLFNIGRRNHAAIRKVLWQHGLFVDAEDVGGTRPRNMYLSIADGTVTVKTQGESTDVRASESMALRFLIVDDSTTTRAIIKRTIQMSQVPTDTVLEAANGMEALRVLACEAVDLVMADLHMPDMDGLEMTRRLLSEQSTRHIPVVVISAEPNCDRLEQMKREGVRGYQRKPFTPESLRALVTETLGVCDG